MLLAVPFLCSCIGIAPDDLQRAAPPKDETDDFTGTRWQTMTTAPLGFEWKDGARIFSN